MFPAYVLEQQTSYLGNDCCGYGSSFYQMYTVFINDFNMLSIYLHQIVLFVIKNTSIKYGLKLLLLL